MKDVPTSRCRTGAKITIFSPTRAGKLKTDELTEGDYTITNNGAYGRSSAHPSSSTAGRDNSTDAVVSGRGRIAGATALRSAGGGDRAKLRSYALDALMLLRLRELKLITNAQLVSRLAE